jgi:pilus assembly protein CpaB
MKNVVATTVAIILGLIAVILVHSYIQSSQGKGPDMVKVVVALKDIPAGTRISQDVLATNSIPRSAVTGAHIKPDQYNLILNKEILCPINRGEPLLLSLFKTEEKRVTDLIDIGKRAMTLKVNQLTGVANQIRPGDYVDLFVTIKTYQEPAKVEQYTVLLGGKTPASVQTMLLLTKVNVLSIDYKTSREVLTGLDESKMSNYSTITVLATPQECEILTFAQSFADISCVLRNPNDTMHPTISEINMDLFKQMAEHSQKLRSKE